jgi:hypothetical protein
MRKVFSKIGVVEKMFPSFRMNPISQQNIPEIELDIKLYQRL